MNELDDVLARVLWACYVYWQRSDHLPPEKRGLCYTWVRGIYEERFGEGFHQSKMGQLARMGFLVPEESSRSGHRRYYRLADPQAAARVLRAHGLL